MSRRKQRLAMRDYAKELRETADAIQALTGPFTAPDRIAAAEVLIQGGTALFDAAAGILRSDKPTPDELTAADALETTAAAWRSKEA